MIDDERLLRRIEARYGVRFTLDELATIRQVRLELSAIMGPLASLSKRSYAITAAAQHVRDGIDGLDFLLAAGSRGGPGNFSRTRRGTCPDPAPADDWDYPD